MASHGSSHLFHNNGSCAICAMQWHELRMGHNVALAFESRENGKPRQSSSRTVPKTGKTAVPAKTSASGDAIHVSLYTSNSYSGQKFGRCISLRCVLRMGTHGKRRQGCEFPMNGNPRQPSSPLEPLPDRYRKAQRLRRRNRYRTPYRYRKSQCAPQTFPQRFRETKWRVRLAIAVGIDPPIRQI